MEAGAAVMLLQREVTPETLRAALVGLLRMRRGGRRWRNGRGRWRGRERCERIAEMVLRLAGR